MTAREARVSETSLSVDDINVPEISNLKASFTYNFFVKNERISTRPLLEEDTRPIDNVPLDKLARYVTLSWKPPANKSSGYQTGAPAAGLPSISAALTLGKILSEDNFFNPSYVNHTFSNIAAIEQGATDIENYSRLSNDNTESLFQMSNLQVKKVGLSREAQKIYDSVDFNKIASISDAYIQMVDFPVRSLGLRVYDENKNLKDKGDLISSITNSISLNVKLSNTVIPDVFGDSSKITPNNLAALSVLYNNSVSGLSYVYNQQRPFSPVLVDSPNLGEDLGNAVSVIGYIIESYTYSNGDFYKQSTYCLDGSSTSSFVDKAISFGKKYFYTVRTVAAVKLYMYEEGTTNVRAATVYVSSRPITTYVKTFEEVPPPEPTQIRFSFDYSRRKLIIGWEMPINPQRDIKQFQVFRRSSLKHPFELIAQYGFDDSQPDAGGTRYKTGEVVDANNYSAMRPDLKYLIKQKEGLVVTQHVDEDFVVDSESYESSEYIYAICSVDAHGFVSNYSTQYRVKFDSYRNKLKVDVVCDSGCPRQYPNLKLNVDTFKDVITVSGTSSKKMNLYFSANKYLKLRDTRRSSTFNVVEAKTPGSPNSYYLFQMINLDSQKLQLLKINVNDPEGLTVT